jgi:hypothetical protein
MIDVMNTAIGEKLRKVRLLSDQIAWQQNIDARIRQEILFMIREDQLMQKRIDANGNHLGFYSWMTEAMSKGRKKEGDPYNLYDTGEFHNKMFVVVLRDSLAVDSEGADKENVNLFKEYGDNIVGLTDENMGKLIELLRPKYIAWAKKMLDCY